MTGRSRFQRYYKGRRREYRTMRFLEKLGHLHVFRSAGSHGVVDVIAIQEQHNNGPILRLIQVKSGRRREDFKHALSTEEASELQRLAWSLIRKLQPSVEMWFWHDRAREPQIRKFSIE